MAWSVRHVRKALMLATAFTVLGASAARAQTVWLRNMPAGAAGELMVNDDKAASGAADADGLVELRAHIERPKDTPTGSMHVFIEDCDDNLHRVLLVDNGRQPPATGGLCQRTPIPDLFEVREGTTFVIDASGSHSVRVRQGPAYKEWLHPELDENGDVKITREPVPGGLNAWVGVTHLSYGDLASKACGDASACTKQASRTGLSAGATLWLTRFLGADISYLQAQDVTAAGSDTNLSFSYFFRPRVVRAVGLLGLQAGPTRIYGMAGADYATVVSSTTQSVAASTKGQGGQQTTAIKTRGLGLVWGGGIEAWFGRRVGVFGEGGRALLKGSAVDGGQGSTDAAEIFATLGVRFHVK